MNVKGALHLRGTGESKRASQASIHKGGAKCRIGGDIAVVIGEGKQTSHLECRG
jgi:hypothetical protein